MDIIGSQSWNIEQYDRKPYPRTELQPSEREGDQPRHPLLPIESWQWAYDDLHDKLHYDNDLPFHHHHATDSDDLIVCSADHLDKHPAVIKFLYNDGDKPTDIINYGPRSHGH